MGEFDAHQMLVHNILHFVTNRAAGEDVMTGGNHSGRSHLESEWTETESLFASWSKLVRTGLLVNAPPFITSRTRLKAEMSLVGSPSTAMGSGE